jgi:hypothetical protein
MCSPPIKLACDFGVLDTDMQLVFSQYIHSYASFVMITTTAPLRPNRSRSRVRIPRVSRKCDIPLKIIVTSDLAKDVCDTPVQQLWKWWQGEQEWLPFLDPNRIKSKTLLKNNGRYSGIYIIDVDLRKFSGRSSVASIFGGKNRQWEIGGKSRIRSDI